MISNLRVNCFHACVGSFCLGRQNSCFGYKSGFQSKVAISILTFFRLSYVSQISVDFISYICNSSALRLLMNCFRFYANFFLPKLELNSTLISRVKEISVFRVKITVVTCNSWARWWIVLVRNMDDALSQVDSCKHAQETITDKLWKMSNLQNHVYTNAWNVS